MWITEEEYIMVLNGYPNSVREWFPGGKKEKKGSIGRRVNDAGNYMVQILGKLETHIWFF